MAPSAPSPPSPPPVRLDPVLPAAAGAVGQLLVYVLVGVVLILILIAIVRFVTDARSDREDAGADETRRERDTESEAGDQPLPDPDRLAAAGRFGEAVHALLLHTIARLGARAPSPPPASATGRELLSLLSLPPAAREALQGLVSSVEIFLFADGELREADWQANRERFRMIQGAMR